MCECGLEKGASTCRLFVGEDVGETDAGSIIDTDYEHISNRHPGYWIAPCGPL